MTRIALVLRGSGSLGAYAAGACSELMLALERNRLDTGAEVDVIAGSAAGGFTAALLARALVVNRHLAPWIERCWVDALDARNVFAAGRGGSGPLDAAALDELSRGLITADPATDDGASPLCGDSLQLGVFPGGNGSDAADFTLTAANRAGDPAWEAVRRAAVAAFAAPTSMPASVDTGPWVPAPESGETSILALARTLAQRSAGMDEERLYVVIDPARAPATNSGHDTAAVGGWGESADSRRLLDELIARLPDIIDRLDDPGALALGRHVGDLAERAAELESGSGTDDERLMDLIDDSLERIEQDSRWAPILARAESRSGRTRLSKLIYVLEAACGPGAGGGTIALVAPAVPESLACRALGGLGGFFERGWREADFRAGRRDARDAIGTSLSAWIDYEPDDEGSYRVPPTPAGLDADAEARLRAVVEAGVGRELADVRVSGLAGLFGGWRNAVKKHAADRVVSSLRADRS